MTSLHKTFLGMHTGRRYELWRSNNAFFFKEQVEAGMSEIRHLDFESAEEAIKWVKQYDLYTALDADERKYAG